MSIRFLGLLIVVAGCGPGESGPSPASIERVDVQDLTALRIYFGHQSVGRDVLAGISTVAPELRVASVDSAPSGAALIEGSIGHNQHPDAKDRSFLEAVSTLGHLDLALYKYCYVDLGPETDPVSLFAAYSRTVDEAPARTVPVTLPLTTIEPAWKRWLKQITGRPTQVSLNARRMGFNELVRERYGVGVIDLARMESTAEDGTRYLAWVDGKGVEYLAPEFTVDGAHLNERGRRVVAARFLEALARAASDP